MIDKTEEMNALLDAYDVLLTPKQQEVMTFYFKEDLSLSEIAEELTISRAAVSDHIKRSSELLQEYEKKLHLVKNYEKRIQIYDKMKSVGNDDINKYIKELENVEN